MVFVHPHRWREANLGRRVDIQVDSNCGEVELAVNGRSVGRRRPSPANFHTVSFADVPVERAILAARCTDRPDVRHEVSMAGPPARLTLTADQARLIADRSGVAIVTADIVDAEGRHVYGATHPLDWEVEGPGRLVGAPRYETDIAKTLEMEGAGYIDAPVKNVVRSAAIPGTIRVRVSSPGLAPAEITIDSRSPAPPADDGVVEVALSDAGRRPVERDTSYNPVAEALSDAPRLARIENENNTFPPSSDAELRAAVEAFIRTRNPDADRSTPAFRALLDRLVETVKRTDRQLIPDDYNFAVENYNDAMRIARYAEALRFHPEYKRVLDRYYADLLVTRGRPLDLQAEQQRLAPLVSGSRLARIVAPNPGEPAASYQTSSDSYLVPAETLTEVLELMVKEQAEWTPETRARAIRRLAEVNPQLSGGAAARLPPGAVVLVPSSQALQAPR